MPIHFHALPTDTVRALQNGQTDFYGQLPERTISDGAGNPCRHCLSDTPEGRSMLILAYRPFLNDQPYAEVGPIFLCGEACERHLPSGKLPPILQSSNDFLIKGYGADDRIVYGTGVVVARDKLIAQSEHIFATPKVRYIHVRSARNNCYQCKITRGE
ncbi:hypothetical protein A9Q96_02250 [Rhodobacterales bacterium 52_120_T64]|nr:hypothetical protein A9Q96_02250 [Rhodobacterales bacterium 52_120_T64]